MNLPLPRAARRILAALSLAVVLFVALASAPGADEDEGHSGRQVAARR